jgi:hypothetical protein
VIIELRPSQGAGELWLGASGPDTVEVLKRLGNPEVLCRVPQDRPGWGILRRSGLSIGTYFDSNDRLNAIEFGRMAFWRPTVPESPDDPDGRFFESVLIAAPGYYGDEKHVNPAET